ncbi:N-acetylmuramoyl-L-alanine amidase [Anaeromassilibacillus senegalensis]|uniref:N-acetylmuramoyl-L-alanine amidase n=1 Tax=Anaeromassilibacillus senegalensis TaxID=1673717 RepID=UPI00068351F7|nr:N-acetylmuramoyl-L-alanine amidase [Anaeromassilibacillus senegalensis]
MNRKWKTLLSAVAMILTLCMTAAVAGSAASVDTQRYNGPNGRFKVYLSPAAQPWNPYVDGSGSEEYYMRQVANAMIPYLQGYGIDYILAGPQTGASANQKQFLVNRANEAKNGGCDLYLAIHSNAANGKASGTRIYYYTKSAESLRFAKVLQSNFCYPDKSNIKLAYNDALMEMYLPTMPHALIETAFHDNAQDVVWIKNNIDNIAKSMAAAVNEYAKGSVGTAAGLSIDRIFANMNTSTALILNVSSTAGGAVPDLKWSSSNPGVASVDQDGFVLAMSAGETVITATTPNGQTVRCTVTVSGPTMQYGLTTGPIANAEGEYVPNPTEESGPITPSN